MSELAERIRASAPWYHTLEFPSGEATEGYFDLRPVVPKLPLPASLAGQRCLDAAACEGFWSFELARRGAAEVVSLDLADTARQDWQGVVAPGVRGAGAGLASRHFELAREALGLDNVTRVDLNVYEADPERLGTFDYVFVGNVLIHLADPARALRALGSVLSGGELLSLEAISLPLTLVAPRLALGQLWDVDDQPRWWTPNMAAHRRWLHAAGFEVLEQGGPLRQPLGTLLPRCPRRPPTRWRELVFWTCVRPFGAASSWVRARPR